MEQKNKDLLIQDLCARLPYEVKCNISRKNTTWVKSRTIDNTLDCHWLSECKADFYEIKPYLFHLSSMTEEQKAELNKLTYGSVSVSKDYFYDSCNCSKISTNEVINIVDWLNKNHFDYRGLIEKGLAIDANGLNIY